MITSESHRLLALPARGLLSGQHVGVADGFPVGPALLSADGAGSDAGLAVVVHHVPDVPPGILAIGTDLHEDLGGPATGQWSLRQVPEADVGRLVLELPTERDPDQVATQIPRAGLAGRVLWVPDGSESLYLDVGSLPYRVLDLDVGPVRGVVGRITASTRVELFAPGVKAGVDMVILADCSGSMTWDDIPVSEPTRSMRDRFRGHHSGPYHITRQELLQQALDDLLRVRLQVSGRVSRIALLGFTTRTLTQFPPQGGMAELDASSPSHVIEQFRSGIANLPADGGTDIPNALHAAADLLHRHGHPKNERLIVLVSDGANWAPQGDRGTGDVRRASEEPVSLMAHLHQNMNVRLHAIGLSTREMFHQRYPRENNPSVVPNHRLLEELVKVGGGDPTRIGGQDVLLEYFSGVGTGVAHQIRGPLSGRPAGGLDDEALRRLRAAVPTVDRTLDLAAAVEQLGEAFNRLDPVALRVFGGPLFPRQVTGRASEELDKAVRSSGIERRLARLTDVLALTEGAVQRLASVRAWTELLGQIGRAAREKPTADLDAIARTCGGTGTESAELLLAVVHRLIAALAEVEREAAGLPDHRAQAPVPADPTERPSCRHSGPGRHSGRGAATDPGEDDAPSRPRRTPLTVKN